MSVEAGPSGAIVAGVAAPVVVNEGPVSLSALENTMTIAKFNPVGEIAFKPSVPSVIEQAEAVAAAAWDAPQAIISEAQEPALKQPEAVSVPDVIPLISPITSTIVEDNVFPVVSPLVEPSIKTGSKIENRVSSQVTPVVSPQPLLQEQEVEEIVMEKAEQVVPENSLEEEEEEIEKRLFLEDEKASAVRKFEIRQAIKLAFASVKDAKLSTVVGSLVARFLPVEHTGNRSQALHEKGPDGSYEETVEAIASSGEFSSPEQAEKRFEEIVAEKKPIKNGKEGNRVTLRDVLRVFRFRAVKPPAAVEIYTKRVVKKQIQVAAGPTAVEAITETNEIPLEELSPELAEVFEKAAA